MSLDLNTILIVALIWVLGALIYFRKALLGTNAKILKSNEENKDITKQDFIAKPTSLYLKLSYEKGDIPENMEDKLFFDMSIRLEDLMSGDYKVPQKILEAMNIQKKPVVRVEREYEEEEGEDNEIEETELDPDFPDDEILDHEDYESEGDIHEGIEELPTVDPDEYLN